jgi:hypothetical protein
LEEKIEEDKEAKKRDCGQLSKQKKISMSDLEHHVKKEEGQAGEALKARVNLT